MKWLDDNALERLRAAAELPDLGGTRYQVLGRLGHGGMGSVYRVADGVLGREVALKVIAFPDRDGGFADRLVREARILAQLEHPGIVPVHDAGTLPDGRVFYTMKLVNGQRIDEHVQRLAALNEKLRLFQRICEPVAFAHAHGVLHRDLKPQNIMVGPFGEVLVMDWGLSKVIADDALAIPNADSASPGESTTGHGAVLGTPGYMSPEQARGEAATLDRRSDIFSLGAILKGLLDDVEVPIPRRLRAIASKCLESDRTQRYNSVEELAQDIANYLDGLQVKAHPEGPVARLGRWMVKNQAWLLLILAYLVMRTLFIVWKNR